MTTLSHKIKLYAEANSKTVDFDPFEGNVELRNDGDEKGDYIFKWDISGLAKPGDSDLTSYQASATKTENNSVVIRKRLTEYPDVGDVIDAIFKKEAGNSTEFDALVTKRQAIKDANPKS